MTTPTTDLRTALTKLAERCEAIDGQWWVSGELRALLAAHPAPETETDTRREDDALVETVARALADDWNPDRDPVLTAMFRDYAQTAVTTVLAVLPAPPVVDGGWTVADWEEWAGEVASTLPEDCDGDEAQVEIIAKFVRRAAAVPVVDEAEIDAVGALAAREMLTPGSTFLLPHERAMVHHVGRAVAAHMRGTTRG